MLLFIKKISQKLLKEDMTGKKPEQVNEKNSYTSS